MQDGPARGISLDSAAQGAVCVLLYSQRREAGVHVFPELRMQVAPRRYGVPDIAVTKRRCGNILREPAFLCVEILSPEDRVTRIEE
jgi:Uma2 family endonuclease